MLLLLLLPLAALSTHCTESDRRIYTLRGHEFPALFRSYAGLTVSRTSYEERIASEIGLSPSCAQCYGEAYICGWNSCKWKCVSDGDVCNVCLGEYHCIENCNQCTGLIPHK